MGGRKNGEHQSPEPDVELSELQNARHHR